jgi:hypothetical protein
MKVFYGAVIGLLTYSLASFGGETFREQQAREAYSRWQQSGTASPEEKLLMEEVLFSDQGQERNNALDESGGPDAFGYRWVDSQTPDTAVFNWVELCGDPMAQLGPIGDDVAGLISWSFAFPFYGENYSSVYVSTNGKLSFSTADPAWLNRCASYDATQPVISVHWDDLVSQQTDQCADSITPRITYRDFGDQVVIEWNHVWHYPYSGDDQLYTFEAALYADGRIKLQYDSLNCGSYCNSATVGIDVPGANGLEYVCTGVPAACQLDHHRAVWFVPGAASPPEAPQELTIQATQSDVTLRWHSVPSAGNYCVYRSVSSDVEPIPANLIATTPDTVYTDVGGLSDPSGQHFYTVTAVAP